MGVMKYSLWLGDERKKKYEGIQVYLARCQGKLDIVRR